MKTFEFYGHSDDLLVCTGPGYAEEVGCYERPGVYRVASPGGASGFVRGRTLRSHRRGMLVRRRVSAGRGCADSRLADPRDGAGLHDGAADRPARRRVREAARERGLKRIIEAIDTVAFGLLLLCLCVASALTGEDWLEDSDG